MSDETNKTYSLSLNQRQLRVVASALEFYGRSFTGQLDLWHVCVDNGVLSWRDRDLVEGVFKHVLGLDRSASYGIYSESVPDQARQSWDVCKVIRHALWLEGDQEHWCVDSDPPSQCGLEPLPVLEVVDKLPT